MCLVQGDRGLQGVGVLSCLTTVTLEVASLFTHQTPTHHQLAWSGHWGHSRGRGDHSLLGQSQHPSAGGGKIRHCLGGAGGRGRAPGQQDRVMPAW